MLIQSSLSPSRGDIFVSQIFYLRYFIKHVPGGRVPHSESSLAPSQFRSRAIPHGNEHEIKAWMSHFWREFRFRFLSKLSLLVTWHEYGHSFELTYCTFRKTIESKSIFSQQKFWNNKVFLKYNRTRINIISRSRKQFFFLSPLSL